jgi:salicylate hydroxylase
MPSAPDPHADNASGPLRVAIIGAGITGVNLALGLQARGVNYTIYERAPGFREIGAGIGFSPNAERAMGLLDPGVLAAFKTVANPNGEDYFQWVDGHGTDELMFRLHVGKDGFQGCRRSDVLEEWARLIPARRVKFGRQIDGLDEGRDGVVIMKFTDGSREEADVGRSTLCSSVLLR